MSHNLNSFFASPFYINAEYAHSLIPSLYQNFISKERIGKTEIEKQQNVLSIQIAESNSKSTTTPGSVVVISIKQPIQKFSDYYSLGSKSFMNIMNIYRNDDSVAGIVLDIDSGGGQVYGTGEFYDFIKEFTKPIVAYTDGYMCSAAYYLGNATQYIVANKRADHIGSIGAYATIVDFNGIIEHFGGKIHEIYASKSTEKNADYRDAMTGNYENYIKNVLDPIVEIFHSDMKATRPNLNEAVFAGGTWNGVEALTMGLIDELGTLEIAINKVLELSNATENTSINKSNINMSKNLPKLEACLGLETPLASNDNGTFLNETQLDQVEASLDNLATENATLQAQLTDATTANTTAVSAITTQLTEVTTSLTAVEASVDASLTNAGLPVEGSLTEKLTLLETYAAAKGLEDGSSHTKIKRDNSGSSEASTIVGGYDVAAALNN